MQSPYLDADGSVTQAFADEYNRVRAGETDPQPSKAATEWRPGTIGWLFQRYQRSKTFQEHEKTTQRDKFSVLGRFCANVGHLEFQKLRKSDVEASQMLRLKTPAAADKLVKCLKALFHWAMEDEEIQRRYPLNRNPAKGISKLNKSDGFHTWTEAEIATFRSEYPLGTTARLAFELLYNLGVRRSDLVALGPSNAQGNNIVFVPQKGSKMETLVLPMSPALKEALALVPASQKTFVVTEYGKPFSSNGFGNKMRDWCNRAQLFECSSHGLRKAAATVLAEAGATEYQLMAVFGWSDPKTARIYTRKARQRCLAASAFDHLNRKNPIQADRLQAAG